MSQALRDEIVSAIEKSVAEFRATNPEDAVLSFGLCTDEDLRTLYGAICSSSRLAASASPEVRFHAAEWKELGRPCPFSEASRLQSALADAEYEREGDNLEPWEDDKRPWKADLYATLVAALKIHRERGTFDEDVFVIATSHDSGEWLLDKIDAATRSLNSAELYGQWRRAVLGE